MGAWCDNGFKLSILPECLSQPLSRKKPTMYFVNSMSDFCQSGISKGSGSKARPMKESWATAVRDQCIEQNVNFFFKQWGAWGADGRRRSKAANGRKLQGQIWDMLPA